MQSNLLHAGQDLFEANRARAGMALHAIAYYRGVGKSSLCNAQTGISNVNVIQSIWDNGIPQYGEEEYNRVAMALIGGNWTMAIRILEKMEETILRYHEDFGKILKAFRHEKRLTVEAVAHRIGNISAGERCSAHDILAIEEGAKVGTPPLRPFQMLHIIKKLHGLTNLGPASSIHSLIPEKMRGEYSPPLPFDESILMPVAGILAEAAKQLDCLAVYDEEAICKIATDLFGRLLARSPIGFAPRAARRLARSLNMKVTEATLKSWINGDSVNLDLLAKNGLVDDLVSVLGIDQPLRAKAARCLLGIPFCTDKEPIHALMDYARRHPQDVGPRDVICIAKRMQRKSVAEYRQELGLGAPLWQHLWDKAGRTERRRMRSVEEIGRKIGCSSDEDLATWRQLVVGIPRSCTQEALNECFSPTGRAGYKINTSVHNHKERAAEFRTFLHHLCQRHGFQNPIDLARCIVERTATDISSSKLANGIKYLSSNASNHNRLLPDQADLIARFAFPNDLSLQEKCRRFLGSEEYLRQPEAKAAAVSAAMLRSRRRKHAIHDRL